MGDTICALASGAPPSAIAVIRVSGSGVADVIARHLRPAPRADRRAILSELINLDGRRIDEGLAIYMPGPQSYTGEDTLELSLHGGRAIVEAALETLCGIDGVRLAEPGEFTRRAFENGKLDLVQAEGVADLIEAETLAQAQQASRQLRGGLSEIYRNWRNALLDLMASLEVAIDFPDEGDVTETADREMVAMITALKTEIDTALADDRIGERIRDGFEIAIVGAPNAGKSTLLNALARTDAAIVTDQPGTTRDVVQVRLKIAGHLVWLKDTAGLRETDDRIEGEGIRRAEQAASEADLRLHLAESASDDWMASAELWCAGDIRIRTKSDLERGTEAAESKHIEISARTGEGLAALEARLEAWVREQAGRTEAPIITRTRHRAALSDGRDHLARAADAINRGDGPELAAEDLRLANRALGSILGEVGVEDILGAVFSEFCIGK